MLKTSLAAASQIKQQKSNKPKIVPQKNSGKFLARNLFERENKKEAKTQQNHKNVGGVDVVNKFLA